MHMHTQTAALAVRPEVLPEVRLLVEADLPAALALGRELHRENGMMELSERRVMEMGLRAVNKNRAICGVIGPVGKPEAMIFLVVGLFWYTEQPHLEEIFTYVKPEFRRSNRAKALIMFAKSCAIELNAPLLIGIISNHHTEAKIRMYRRQLGEPAGGYFLFNGKTGSKQS